MPARPSEASASFTPARPPYAFWLSALISPTYCGQQGELEAEFAQDVRITCGYGEHSSGGRTPTAPAESSARKAARSSFVLPPSRSPGL